MPLIKHTACKWQNLGNWDAFHWTHACERILATVVPFTEEMAVTERILVTEMLSLMEFQ